MEVDVERIRVERGVPFYRLWLMRDGEATQTVVDGIALIALGKWLADRLGDNRWPAACELATLRDGLPRISRLVVPNRGMAEQLYQAVSRGALDAAHMLFVMGAAWEGDEDDEGDEYDEDEE